MTRSRLPLLPLMMILTLGLATAATLGEVQADATSLVGDLQTLDGAISACPDGDCPERVALEAQFAALEQAGADPHADRDSLEPCSSCGSLDVTIAQADALASTLRHVIGGWSDDE